jgi:hypothetical protein
VETDPWERKVPCERATLFETAMTASLKDHSTVDTNFPSFAKRWGAVAGTQFQANFKDCLNVAGCTMQKGLKLPIGLQPGTALFQEALKVSLAVYHKSYLRDVRAQQLLMAPALLELENFLTSQADGLGPLVAFWSTHDDTMVSMLVALGIWDGIWPPYTDSLVLEVYRSKNDHRRRYFRWVRFGKQLALPWCRGEAVGPSGLCDVRSFLPKEIAVLRDTQRYAEECAIPNENQMETGPLTVESQLPLSLSMCGLAIVLVSSSSCAFGYVLHAAVQRWKSLPTEGTMEQSLLAGV